MSDPSLPVLDEARRLKLWIQDRIAGGCRMFSQGDACQCPLCDLDRLVAVVTERMHMANTVEFRRDLPGDRPTLEGRVRWWLDQVAQDQAGPSPWMGRQAVAALLRMAANELGANEAQQTAQPGPWLPMAGAPKGRTVLVGWAVIPRTCLARQDDSGAWWEQCDTSVGVLLAEPPTCWAEPAWEHAGQATSLDWRAWVYTNLAEDGLYLGATDETLAAHVLARWQLLQADVACLRPLDLGESEVHATASPDPYAWHPASEPILCAPVVVSLGGAMAKVALGCWHASGYWALWEEPSLPMQPPPTHWQHVRYSQDLEAMGLEAMGPAEELAALEANRHNGATNYGCPRCARVLELRAQLQQREAPR